MNQLFYILTFILLFSTSTPCVWAQYSDQNPDITTYRDNYERNLDSLIHTHYLLKTVRTLPTSKKKTAQDSIFAKNLSEIPDSVFIKRLNKIPTTIPLQYNNRVRSLIEFYIKTTQRRGDVFFALSNYYNPIFEEILDKQGLPLEFKYLAIVESALNPRAVSHAGAVGLWQFMYPTAKMYNLKINSLVDERKDPIKSTIAAANYLSDLYKIFNDWTLAIAAYNCGPGNVNKAIRRSGGNPNNFWDIYEFLPAETRGYVPAFVAATYVMNYYQEHNIQPSSTFSPIVTDTVLITENIHFLQIAAVIPELNLELLRELNPQYKNDIIPGNSGSYTLKIPLTKVSTYIKLQDSIINYSANEFFKPTDIRSQKAYDMLYYKVKKGDTWASIARNFGTSEKSVKQWNNTTAKRPQAGKRITIYKENANTKDSASLITKNEAADSTANKTVKKETTQKPNTTQRPATTQNKKVSHKVKSGETYSSIAKKYNTTAAQLMKLNKTKSSQLKKGQVIIISK